MAIRKRVYFLTWNNYPVEWKNVITQNTPISSVSKIIAQPEVGEKGTKHIQGTIWFKNARTFESLKSIHNDIHWEVARNVKACTAYCQKLETRTEETWFYGFEESIKDPLQNVKLYPWQKKLKKRLKKEPDDRTIYWYWDEEGCTGKTSFIKHWWINNNDSILVGGKASDVKFAIAQCKKKPKVVFWNITRTSEQYVSYDGIESVKDGIFFSNKYESGMCVYNPPHVVIFANFEPDVEALSADRWRIVHI